MVKQMGVVGEALRGEFYIQIWVEVTGEACCAGIRNSVVDMRSSTSSGLCHSFKVVTHCDRLLLGCIKVKGVSIMLAGFGFRTMSSECPEFEFRNFAGDYGCPQLPRMQDNNCFGLRSIHQPLYHHHHQYRFSRLCTFLRRDASVVIASLTTSGAAGMKNDI